MDFETFGVDKGETEGAPRYSIQDFIDQNIAITDPERDPIGILSGDPTL